VMYFDKPTEGFDKPMGAEISSVLAVTGFVTLFFFVYPTPVIEGAQAAAALLFP
ncbi:MAG: NADH-quinone oxidoreductase subunit N, partial [Rhodospirillaceae bacterium]|nr:NADH-quinone oxidoreductase subunit N [Rhodospirillaceae bacterium]